MAPPHLTNNRQGTSRQDAAKGDARQGVVKSGHNPTRGASARARSDGRMSSILQGIRGMVFGGPSGAAHAPRAAPRARLLSAQPGFGPIPPPPPPGYARGVSTAPPAYTAAAPHAPPHLPTLRETADTNAQLLQRQRYPSWKPIPPPVRLPPPLQFRPLAPLTIAPLPALLHPLVPLENFNTAAHLLQQPRYPSGRPIAAPVNLPLPPQLPTPAPPWPNRVLKPGQLVTRQLCADYFRNFWWRGDGRPYDSASRQHIWSRINIPAVSGYRHSERAVDLYWEHKLAGRKGAARLLMKLSPGVSPFKKAGQAEQVAALLDDKARVLHKAGMKFRRLLGYGGYGLVALFRAENVAGRIQDVVAKFNLRANNNTSFPKEKAALRDLSRAEHIVQLFSPHEFFGPLLTAKAPGSAMAAPFDADAAEADQNILLLEYSRLGDMGKFIVQLTDDLPPKLLWYLWKCLLMGVIEIEYPPLKQPAHEHLREMPGVHPDYDHRQPGDRPSTLVHFDLDPLNVLVSDGDEFSHNLTPKLQIADFGLASRWPSNRARRDTEAAWNYRRRGKPRFYAPEQFAPEWDSVFLNPASEVPEGSKHVAGNYGWKTNLYQAAQIMWMLITGVEPHFPPTLDWDPAPGAEPPVPPTYGGYLFSEGFKHVDAHIRLTVARCMAHAPDDRPDMAWLVKDLEENVGRVNAMSTPQSDEQLKAGCILLFAEPPSRRQREPVFNPNKPFDPRNPQLNPLDDVRR
ncbi:hypothetical protein RB594_006954 [Gaeumannomyces avenae]